MKYLFGSKSTRIYAIIVALCVFGGALVQVDFVWNLADCLNSLMVLPNILALFILTRQIILVKNDYEYNFAKK